jgi:hypothetical protein
MIDPPNRRPPLDTPQIIVVSAFCDAAVIDDQCSSRPASQSAEFRRVDEETSDAERVGIAVHKTPPLQEHQRMARRNMAITWNGESSHRSKKKIRAAHAKEKQQIRETCNRPNRLNLLTSTATGVGRSKFL